MVVIAFDFSICIRQHRTLICWVRLILPIWTYIMHLNS